jgi:hypothetical protein
VKVDWNSIELSITNVGSHEIRAVAQQSVFSDLEVSGGENGSQGRVNSGVGMCSHVRD